MAKSINGGNYFTEERFNEVIKTLESGETITIYIDCIGHTRAEASILLIAMMTSLLMTILGKSKYLEQ